MSGAPVHVIPVNDAIEHETWSECWCQPTREEHNGGVLYIHHSADGREADEPDALPPATRH